MNMIATRTIRIQLQPTAEQAVLLQQTMQEYTACFNSVCQLADAEKISNGLELHRLTYADHRAATHLPSQLICAARVKATEAIKSVITLRQKQVATYQKRLKQAQLAGKPLKPLKLAKTPHSRLCAIRYDARSFRFDRASRLVSLVHVQQPGQRRNRATLAVKVPPYYEQYLSASGSKRVLSCCTVKGNSGCTWWCRALSPSARPLARPSELIWVSIVLRSLPSLGSLVASASKRPITATSACVVRFKAKVQSRRKDTSRKYLAD
jgi:putative transposase